MIIEANHVAIAGGILAAVGLGGTMALDRALWLRRNGAGVVVWRTAGQAYAQQAKRFLTLLAMVTGAGLAFTFAFLVDGDFYVDTDWAWRWLGTPLVVLFTLWVAVRLRRSVTSGKGSGEGPVL